MYQKHFIKAHLRGSIYRRETFNGRPHIVVPVIMMVEGVHNGSHGPILYMRDELSRFAEAWDGRPVPIFHPEINGMPVPCNMPEVIETRVVGQLFNTHWDDGKLKSEAWIDIEKCRQISPETLAMLEQGEPMDVSTGLYSEDEMKEGSWNGEAYEAIARNIRPEHLALLPGSHGACSWEDGCGVRANQQEDTMEKKGVFARFAGKLISVLSGQDDNDPKKLEEADVLLEKASHVVRISEDSFSDKQRTIQAYLDSLDVQEQKYHYLHEAYDDYFVYMVRVLNGPNAGELLFKQNYAIDGDGKLELSGDPEQVREDTNYVPVGNDVKNEGKADEADEATVDIKSTTNSEEMKMDKEAKVKGLIANKATRFTDEDQEFLMGLEPCQLDKLEPVANEDSSTRETTDADAGNESTETADADADADGEPPAQNATSEDGDKITMTMDQLDKIVDDRIKQHASTDAKARRVEALIDNGCPLDKGELMKLGDASLKVFEDQYKGKSYAGRAGGPTPSLNDGDEGPGDMAPCVLAETQAPKDQ